MFAWNVPELHIPGFARHYVGDNPFWVRVPSNSIVAQLDWYAQRKGVFHADTGKGTGKCERFRALFGYLTEAGPFTAAEYRHQGYKSEHIGEGVSCDDGTYDLGGNVSSREGEFVTFEWIFEQLQLGRSDRHVGPGRRQLRGGGLRW